MQEKYRRLLQLFDEFSVVILYKKVLIDRLVSLDQHLHLVSVDFQDTP